MSKYVLVDTISQFRMRYVVEVPDDCENPTDGDRYPVTPEEYAMDTVTCEDAKEFTQEHLGETIVSTREVTLEEALAQYRKDEPMFGASWDDELIVKNAITPIGYSEREKMAQEEALWNEANKNERE
jgi:hypothetical protein